jgi:hypothetical protein
MLLQTIKKVDAWNKSNKKKSKWKDEQKET